MPHNGEWQPVRPEKAERVCLNELIQVLIGTFSEWAAWKRVSLWAALEKEELAVKGMRSQLARAMQSLLAHAVDACREAHGEVSVMLRRDHDLACVRVQHSREETSEALLRNDVRLDVAQRIVQEHGGCMEVAGYAGAGLAVTLRFLIVPADHAT